MCGCGNKDRPLFYLPCGDTCSLTIEHIYYSGTEIEYEIQPDDEFFFSVKSSVNSSEYILQKKMDILEDGKLQIVILPKETADLSEGTYYFDVRLKSDEDNIHTVVLPTAFELTSTVTRFRSVEDE